MAWYYYFIGTGMSDRSYTRKKYTILLRKLTIQHEFTLLSGSETSAQVSALQGTSDCTLNSQVSVTLYEGTGADSTAQLHIMYNLNGEQLQIGTIKFDARNEKIVKPLAKQYFSKQFDNKRGYLEYKFVGVETKPATQEEVDKSAEKRTELYFRLGQHAVNRQEIDSLIALIEEKDDVIAKMDEEIQRLIKETRRLNKSLSKQKSQQHQQMQRNISLNVKIPTVSKSKANNSKSNANLADLTADWDKQRQEYQYEINQLNKRIRELEGRQRQYLSEAEMMRKKIEVETTSTQRRIADLRKQIEHRYEMQQKKNMVLGQDKRSFVQTELEREKKNRYIEEQLAEQIRKIDEQKERQLRKEANDDLRQQLEKQLERQRSLEKDRDLERSRELQKVKQRERERQRSKTMLRQSSLQHRSFLRELNQLESQRQILKQKVAIKDEEIFQIMQKLDKAQREISRLEDQNVQLRKTKSALLREVEGTTVKAEPGNKKPADVLESIETYEKMILDERRQINDEKLRTEIDELRNKLKKDERQFRQKLQEKEMEVMKLKLSEKSATREKEIYAERIKEMMSNVEGDRKTYLEALDTAHKYETLQARAKQLEIKNKQMEETNYKMAKEKQELTAKINKQKAKLDEQEAEWVKLKSIEAQQIYYKTQCQKLEKANKKFEKQYQSVKQYCQNLENAVGKKPKKSADEGINLQRQEKYKNQIRNKLELLNQQVQDMENKFYLEQIQIWLTERTNIVQFHAKKFEEDKARILQMDDINEPAKQNLIQEKQKQVESIKINQLNDIDRRINKLRSMVTNEERKFTTAGFDKTVYEKTLGQLTQKIQRLTEAEESRKKELEQLKEKNKKLELQLQQKSLRMNAIEVEATQKRSISMFLQQKDKDSKEVATKLEDVRRSYLDEFKKSRDFFMNKPFEQLKKLNSQLQAEKRKVESEMNTLKFSFDKQKVQLNDKIRTKQREIKKLEHEATGNQKTIAKLTADIETLRKARDQLESLVRKMREQLKQVSRTLELKQRQCSEALLEIKRMQKNLQTFEEAEKRMFDDVKKMKQKFQSRELEMQEILSERTQKSKQMDAQRVMEINRLQQQLRNLQYKLQKQITQNLVIKNEKQKLSETITEYDLKLKQKQEQYEVLNETFNIYKTETTEKSQQYEAQNNMLQNNILQIAEEMSRKEGECAELEIKLEYAEKREKALTGMKNQIEQENKALKKEYELLEKQLRQQHEQFMEKVKAFDAVKNKIEAHAEQNAKLQGTILILQADLKSRQAEINEQKIMEVRLEGENTNLATKIGFLQEKILDLNKRVESVIAEKEAEVQRIQTSRRQSEQKNPRSRKSSEGKQKERQRQSLHELSPGVVQRKGLLASSIQKSTSIIQQKSSKNLPVLKRSSRQSRQSSEEQRYEKPEIQVLKPVAESADDLKVTMNIQTRRDAHLNDTSKINIDVMDESEEDQNNGNDKTGDNNQLNIIINAPSPVPAQSKLKQIPQIGKEDRSDLYIDEERSFGHKFEEEQSDHHEHEEEHDQEDIEMLRQKINELEDKIIELEEVNQGLVAQLQIWRNSDQIDSTLRHSNIKINIKEEEHPKFKAENQLLESPEFLEGPRRNELKRTFSQHQGDSGRQATREKDSKRIEELQKQVQELKSKLIEADMCLAQSEQKIRELEAQRNQSEKDRQKLINELTQTMTSLQQEVLQTKKLKTQCEHLQSALGEKQQELGHRIQQLLLEEMEKDETIAQAVEKIEQLHSEHKNKDTIIYQLNTEVDSHKTKIDRMTKMFNSSKNEYRKYEEEAELKILRLRESNDELRVEVEKGKMDLNEMAERYVELEDQLKATSKQNQQKQHAILSERARIKQINYKKQQVVDQMRKFQRSKESLLNRIGELQIQLGERNQQLKTSAKQTAVAYKKYQIQLQAEKQQHGLTRRKLKQRQEHITNLKMEIANYNQTCHGLEKQKNRQAAELSKIERQLKEIMVTYQAELDQLSKDKIALAKQLEKQAIYGKENEMRIDTLNKDISRKSREIKELSFKLEDQQSQMDKLKEKHRKQIGDLVAELELKNDQYHKTKVQLERETEHYFAKEAEYLQDRQAKEQLEREYTGKLQGYQQVIQQLESELKEIQNRPSLEQWQQVCFENELYRNRIEELQTLLREAGEQHEERLVAEFKKYKINKEREIADLESEMEKYGSKFHSLEQNSFLLKKDNESLKTQLRTIMQEKMKMQKTIRDFEEDLKDIRDELGFYKNKRADDLNKLLNETYD